MSCTSADSFSNLQLFFLAFLFFFFLLLRICKLTIRGYVAVYSWSLQRTLTGIPLLEKSNRVAIQFGASTWVNSMKLTEAKLYHSLGDGEMNGNSCIFTEMYGHMTQVFSYSGKQRAVKKKKIKMRFLLSGGVRPAGPRSTSPSTVRGRGWGWGDPEYFILRRGGIGYSLTLAFRILHIHICQLSSMELKWKRNWGLRHKAWSKVWTEILSRPSTH